MFSEMLPFDLCKELFWVLPCIEFMEERVRVRVATRSEADSVPKLCRKAHIDIVYYIKLPKHSEYLFLPSGLDTTLRCTT